MASEASGQLSADWSRVLGNALQHPRMQSLRTFLTEEKRSGREIYPPGPDIFNAYRHTEPHEVSVVILGQDPYHGPGQAHGLCFSVQAGTAIPPSLRNIFNEIEADLGIQPPPHGCLTYWASQGVLLLNAVLTVRRGEPKSHANRGWEDFTDATVQWLNEHRENLVFLLWGSDAQRKGALVDEHRHCVLKAPHPSPLSAHRGFMGCRHFSRANAWLAQHNRLPIDWSLPREIPG